jgi:hypothetical protein
MHDVGAYMRIITLAGTAKFNNIGGLIVVNSGVYCRNRSKPYEPHSFRNEYTAHPGNTCRPFAATQLHR